MSKFRVGEKVRIAKGFPLELNQSRDNRDVGKVSTIREVRTDTTYYLWGTDFYYDEEALVPFEQSEQSERYDIVYKILSKSSKGRLRSQFVFHDHALDYKLLEKTRGFDKTHPICAYDSLQSAKTAIEGNIDSYVMYKCLAKRHKGDVDAQIKADISHAGVVFCKWVIPLEEVS